MGHSLSIPGGRLGQLPHRDWSPCCLKSIDTSRHSLTLSRRPLYLEATDTTIDNIVALLKDKDGNVRRAATEALGRQSNLSDTAIDTFVALLKDENRYVRRAATEALGMQSNLSDMVLDAIGLSLESQRPAKTIYNVQYIESLYGSLLWRGFREQLSLYVDGNGSCIVNQPSGLRRGRFEDGSHKQFLNEVSKGRQLWNTSGYELWNSSPGEGAQQRP